MVNIHLSTLMNDATSVRDSNESAYLGSLRQETCRLFTGARSFFGPLGCQGKGRAEGASEGPAPKYFLTDSPAKLLLDCALPAICCYFSHPTHISTNPPAERRHLIQDTRRNHVCWNPTVANAKNTTYGGILKALNSPHNHNNRPCLSCPQKSTAPWTRSCRRCRAPTTPSVRRQRRRSTMTGSTSGPTCCSWAWPSRCMAHRTRA